MKNIMSFTLLSLCMFGCAKVCTLESLLGEMLRIPLDLSAYSTQEISAIDVWNVNNGDTTSTPLRSNYLAENSDGQYWLTDNNTDGYYSSDLDGSNLYFYFRLSDTSVQLLDSITHITVKKSKGEVDDVCYEDDPNVQIDEISYLHDGNTMGKDNVLILNK
ncbi:MAG: hypothetical protein HOI49_01055 [Bacteroidetes bacterium]|nr:hypothetical protein [Bacteroidota bacterium]